MDLRQLTVFVAVAEERSFSRAAERLQVAQSAVSATIRTLERALDLVLFHRTTHRVELSAAGRDLLPAARSALRAADAVEHAADEIRGGLRGTIRVGMMQATHRTGGISVATAIAAFRAEHPGVAFAVRQGGSADQAAAVRAGELDLGFVGLPERTLPGLALTTLVVSEMLLACHADHRLAGRERVELGMLSGEPFADLPPTWGVRIANDRAFAAAGAHRTVAYEINDIASVADFVRHGLAVAIVPPVTFPEDDRIVFVQVRRHVPVHRVSLALPSDRPSSPAVQAFAAIAARVAAV
jgi:DNA-binding transcriptional LysR family regulator